MVRGKRDGLLIAGGGLAGSLAALTLARMRPEVPVLLVQESENFGGDQLWSFYDHEVDEADRTILEPLISHQWQGYYAAFPGHSRKLKAGIGSFSSAQLDRTIRETLKPDQYMLGTRIVAVRENELVLVGGEKIRAEGAIDARGAANLSMLELGWHRFAGREYRFSKPHGVDRPVMIDATVDQAGGYRFFQCIPFSEDRMLVEEAIYSDAPDFDEEEAGRRTEAYCAQRGWKPAELERQQAGVLPLALGGDFGAFWRVGGARVAKLGLRGGFFHPSTGYSLADAVRMAGLLAKQRDFSGAALHDLFEAEAVALWKKRDFYRGFNAALFKSSPDERRQIYERLFKLDPGTIAGFQNAQAGLLDRRRIQGVLRG